MHNDKQHIDFDLLAKYLSGETSEVEKAEVQQWLEADAGNQKVLDELSAVLGLTEQAKEEVRVDTNAAWNKMQEKIQGKGSARVIQMKPEPTTKSRWRLYGIAATVVGFLLVAGWVFTNFPFNTGNQLMTAMAVDKIVVDSLQDGSVVTLNKNSSLSYYEEFIDGERQVDLTGEAFFEVARDTSMPFVIHADKVSITVLGTSFNVKANHEDDYVEVLVATGKVKVANEAGEEVILLPNEKGVYHKATGELEKLMNDDVAYQWWRLKKLVFTNTALTDVLDVLNKQYEANLSLEDTVSGACRFTGTFNDDSLETILSVLTTTFNLRLEMVENKRILKGRACEANDL